jgi:hypothetical protein
MKQGSRTRLIEMLESIEIEIYPATPISKPKGRICNKSCQDIADYIEEEKLREQNSLAHRLRNAKNKEHS